MNTSDKIKGLYGSSEENNFVSYVKLAYRALEDLGVDDSVARIAADRYNEEEFHRLIKKYSTLAPNETAPAKVTEQIVHDLFVGVPNWSSPRLQYNVGTSVNHAAASVYALALRENIYNINDGLAGNSLVAELAVTNILSDLANITQRPYGIFTFGGTATNMYGIRLGLKKACLGYSQTGLNEKIRIFVTEDAHFSHATAADWLGVGLENVVTVPASKDRTTNLSSLEDKLTQSVRDGYKIGAIIINGGTTYDHAIDDIPQAVKIRDKLVRDYKLTYKPHVHVDSVIGWIWLFFKDYQWDQNPLNIQPATLKEIRQQYDKIKHLGAADSWGVDFHKSIGGCPINCSIIMINDFKDAMYLSRKANGGSDIHQLAQDYSFASPVDYTLETSRSGGSPLAALTSLFTMGMEGYRRTLANLIEQASYMRARLSSNSHIQIANPQSQGFVTMLRLIPPELSPISAEKELEYQAAQKDINDKITAYTKSFFDWDYATRMKKGIGPEYSYSSCYITAPNKAKMGAIKIYPVSPLFERGHADETIETLMRQLATFNKTVWQKHS